MEKIEQPMTVQERRAADRHIEFASTLLEHARWGVAGLILVATFVPLRVLLYYHGMVGTYPLLLILGPVAYFVSAPVTDAAESVRHRQRRPLIMAITLCALVAGMSFLGVLWALAIAIGEYRRSQTDDLVAQCFLVLLAVVPLGVVLWLLLAFVHALSAVMRFAQRPPQGFPVVTATATPPPPPPAFTLPPRPKR